MVNFFGVFLDELFWLLFLFLLLDEFVEDLFFSFGLDFLFLVRLLIIGLILFFLMFCDFCIGDKVMGEGFLFFKFLYDKCKFWMLSLDIEWLFEFCVLCDKEWRKLMVIDVFWNVCLYILLLWLWFEMWDFVGEYGLFVFWDCCYFFCKLK